MSSRCPSCQTQPAADDPVLWDGRQYCSACVEKASPDLLKLAEQGARLEETLQTDDVSAWHFIRYLGRYYFILVLVFLGIPLTLAGIADGNIFGVVLILGYFGGFGAVIILLGGLIRSRRLRSKLPQTISIAETPMP